MQIFPETLAEDLLRVARLIRRETQRRIAPLGLNPHQARALRVIGEAEPLRPSEVAERLGIAARSATDSISGLSYAGYVERRTDPADGRAQLLALSASGRAALAEVSRARSEVAAELFGRLGPTDRSSLAALLATLCGGPPDLPGNAAP